MGQQLSFDEAFTTWLTLTDPSTAEEDWDGSLLRACEALILSYPVANHLQAAAVCAVLSHGTYGREATALDGLVSWLKDVGETSAAPSEAEGKRTI